MITILYRDVETFDILFSETVESWDDAHRAVADGKAAGFVPEIRL